MPADPVGEETAGAGPGGPDGAAPEGTEQGGTAAEGNGEAGTEEPGEQGEGAPHEEPGRPGRQGARRRAVLRRRRRIVLSAAAVVLVVLLALVGWYELQAHPGGPSGKQVVVTVSQGEGAGSVVSDMASKGVVTSGLAFRIFLFFHGTPTVQVGSYLLHQNLTFAAARQALTNGPNVGVVDVPAGFTLHEVAARFAAATGRSASGFLATASSGAVTSPYEAAGSTNLEGLVAPGSYLVFPKESDTAVVHQMVRRFDQQAAKVGATPAAAAALGVTPNQLVTVASIVEKEGVYPINMGRVARVIYNRLANGMPLQMDSTVLYSLGQDGGSVTEKDLHTNTPYNTYLHTGLTPTPVSMPSADALRAAAHPPRGNWLYFVVVTKSGEEAFSSTYAGQLANEALARKRGL